MVSVHPPIRPRCVRVHTPILLLHYVNPHCIAEWEATSRHRFRSGEDMQYAFAFYYYLMNLHKARPLDLDVRACVD